MDGSYGLFISMLMDPWHLTASQSSLTSELQVKKRPCLKGGGLCPWRWHPRLSSTNTHKKYTHALNKRKFTLWDFHYTRPSKGHSAMKMSFSTRSLLPLGKPNRVIKEFLSSKSFQCVLKKTKDADSANIFYWNEDCLVYGLNLYLPRPFFSLYIHDDFLFSYM